MRLDVTERYSNSLLPKSVGQVYPACLGASVPSPHPRPPPKKIKPKHFCLDKETVSCTFRRGMRMVAPLHSNAMSVSVPGKIEVSTSLNKILERLSSPGFEKT